MALLYRPTRCLPPALPTACRTVKQVLRPVTTHTKIERNTVDHCLKETALTPPVQGLRTSLANMAFEELFPFGLVSNDQLDLGLVAKMTKRHASGETSWVCKNYLTRLQAVLELRHHRRAPAVVWVGGPDISRALTSVISVPAFENELLAVRNFKCRPTFRCRRMLSWPLYTRVRHCSMLSSPTSPGRTSRCSGPWCAQWGLEVNSICAAKLCAR